MPMDRSAPTEAPAAAPTAFPMPSSRLVGSIPPNNSSAPAPTTDGPTSDEDQYSAVNSKTPLPVSSRSQDPLVTDSTGVPDTTPPDPVPKPKHTTATRTTTPTISDEPLPPLHHDVLIIGAGISGINTAHRIQTFSPTGSNYLILEARHALGGTWDLFKYPGIRSDSDLYTFGFPWRAWNEPKAIATGNAIKAYLADSAREYGIDEKIRYGHKVIKAAWDSGKLEWRLDVLVSDGPDAKTVRPRTVTGRFIIFGTGYYDYDTPLEAVIPGLNSFGGEVIHPQFWPENYNYADKRIAIIGSGATAITLLPNIATKAAHVVMVQRSPSYIFSVPVNDKITRLTHRVLPPSLAFRVDRLRFLFMGYFFFYFCRTFPSTAKKLVRLAATKQLPASTPHDPHFVPSYNPWEQRLCISPDGDFFHALRRGNASIATGTIRGVDAKGIELDSGQRVDCDVIVTATGLKIALAGNVQVEVDGVEFKPHEKFMWKGIMLQDLPNAAFVIGYTNASWTLGAEATAQMAVRIMWNMEKHAKSQSHAVHEKKKGDYEGEDASKALWPGRVAIVPRVANHEAMESTPMLNLNSTYIQRAAAILPKTGNKGQWRPRNNYWTDLAAAKWGDVQTSLEYLEMGKKG